MYWVIHCLDAPDALALRAQHRAAHSAHLTSGSVRAVLAGPLLAGDGLGPEGSLLVLAAEQREDVERWLADDPFTVAGVWRQVSLHGFTPSSKTPVAVPA